WCGAFDGAAGRCARCGGRAAGGGTTGARVLVPGPRRGRKPLTRGTRARKPAEIAALSEGGTGDEETHVGRLRHLLRLHVAAQAEQQHSRGCQKQKTQGVVHRSSSVRLVLGLLAPRPLAAPKFLLSIRWPVPRSAHFKAPPDAEVNENADHHSHGWP